MKILLFILIIFSALSVHAQVNTLFEGDSIINISLYYPSDSVKHSRNEDSKYFRAKLELENLSGNSQSFDIDIKTRGIFRLKSTNCYFPPLLIKFSKKDIKKTIFKGNSKLKLVYPCNKNNTYQQYILLEYLAYRIYNQLTDYSLKVRLVKLKLLDLAGKDPEYDKYAFLIEPDNSLAKRVNGKEMEVKNIHPDLTDKQMINLLSIFQYMIGNTDWSVKALHNIVLIARDSMQNPVAVPYDFDFSGLVNAEYALPAEHLNIRSVRERYYNGYGREMDEIMPNIEIFKREKENIYKLVRSIVGLDEKNMENAIKYLDQFYKIIDDPAKIKKEFIDNSRTD